ncbi:MAG: DUF2946 family protein [Candidatus Hydrogenedentes bacterium]|nr:DUF2946 family protein [Candidatus Hydrogenedentota bacterium]
MIRRRYNTLTAASAVALLFSVAFQVCAPGFHYALAHAEQTCEAHGAHGDSGTHASLSQESSKSHSECLVCVALAHHSRNAAVAISGSAILVAESFSAEPFTTCLDLPRPSLLTHAGRAPPTLS